METMQRPDSDDDEAGTKLFPEWEVDADDQVVLAGLAAVLGLLLFFGWTVWRGGDDDLATVASSSVSSPTASVDRPVDSGDRAAVGSGIGGTTTVTSTDSDSDAASDSSSDTASSDAGSSAEGSANSSSTTRFSNTTAQASASLSSGDLSAALSGLPGAITAGVDGDVAVLDGFVANQSESDAAEQAAAAVDGVERVVNNLVILEPQVIAALDDAGVVGASAIGVGTKMTLSGTIQSEDVRQAALEAATTVEGVTAVEDQIGVSVAADLNQLPQVRFGTGSSDILPASFADLDSAAELITAAGDVKLSVVGWTDTRGDDTTNLELSQARADAVVAYLVGAGVPEAALTAEGKGETDQYAAGATPEALQANRVVLFEQTG